MAVNAAGGSGPGGAAAADAFGQPIDARVTEGTAELVVTPVAESVARSSEGLTETATEDANRTAAEAPGSDTSVNGSGTKIAAGSSAATGVDTASGIKCSVVSVDVPHDQQPA